MKNNYEKKMTVIDAYVSRYLLHSGTKGMHWRQHGEGKRWQSQAVYANGQPDPDAKEKKAKATDKEVKEFRDKLDSKYEQTKGKKAKEAFSELVQDTAHNAPKYFKSAAKTTAIMTALTLVCPPAALIYAGIHNARIVSNAVKQARYQ